MRESGAVQASLTTRITWTPAEDQNKQQMTCLGPEPIVRALHEKACEVKGSSVRLGQLTGEWKEEAGGLRARRVWSLWRPAPGKGEGSRSVRHPLL